MGPGADNCKYASQFKLLDNPELAGKGGVMFM